MNKYRNKQTVVDGKKFQSQHEANHYGYLKLRLMAKEIRNLELQKSYELIPKQRLSDGNMLRECCYKADFVYEENGTVKVVDTKSEITRKEPCYIIKKKLMKFIHNIEIIEA